MGGLVSDSHVQGVRRRALPKVAERVVSKFVGGNPGMFATLKPSPEIFTPWLKIYLADHRDRIFGQAA